MMKKLLILPGDGIGKEVCDAVLPVFTQLALPIDIEFGEIGWTCWQRDGNPIPDATWEKITRSDAVLLGAITSKGKNQAQAELAPSLQGHGLHYISPIIQLRQRLDLFANVRPVEHIVGNCKPFRCCVIRENTEGLYAGIDQRGIPTSLQNLIRHPNLEKSGADNATFSIRLQTQFGLQRLFRYAFDYASQHQYTRVTFADKANVLRESGQFAADLFYAMAADYPDIHADIQNVDAVALWLVRRPESFGVIVAENMFADILSDLAAGIMGGLGLAPSANIGMQYSYFEPVHGSAPHMAGQGRANPAALFFTVALLLNHLGYQQAAAQLKQAVRAVILCRQTVTPDLGGSASTQTMAQAILTEMATPAPRHQRVSILCIGDELLRGEYINSNASEFSQRLQQAGYQVERHLVCGDQSAAICHAIDLCLGHADIVLINGGLGPTSDDITREAIAASIKQPLYFDQSTWEAIQARLQRFNLAIHPSNRRQALFPHSAHILPNPNGSAAGFCVTWQNKKIYALPGPAQECLPMLDTLLATLLLNHTANAAHQSYQWCLLNVVEADIAAMIDSHIENITTQAKLSYLWRYPYTYVYLVMPPNHPQHATTVTALDHLLKAHNVSRDGRSDMMFLNETSAFKLNLNDAFTPTLLSQQRHYHYHDEALKITVSLDSTLHPPYTGSLALYCGIEIKNKLHEYHFTLPKRGPEVIDAVRELTAWSILRTHAQHQACDPTYQQNEKISM